MTELTYTGNNDTHVTRTTTAALMEDNTNAMKNIETSTTTNSTTHVKATAHEMREDTNSTSDLTIMETTPDDKTPNRFHDIISLDSISPDSISPLTS